MNKAYEANGDMIPDASKQRFRRVAWRVEGGVLDGTLFDNYDLLKNTIDGVPHGGFTPLYMEVGLD